MSKELALKALTAKNISLTRAQKWSRCTMEELRGDITHARDIHDDLQQKYYDLQDEYEKLKEENGIINRRADSLDRAMTKMEEENAELRHSLAETKQRNIVLISEVENMHGELLKASGSSVFYEERMRDLRDKQDMELKKARKRFSDEVEAMDQRCQQRLKILEDRIAHEREQYQKVVSESETTLQDLVLTRQELKSAQLELKESAIRQRRDKERELLDLRQEIDSLKVQLSASERKSEYAGKAVDMLQTRAYQINKDTVSREQSLSKQISIGESSLSQTKEELGAEIKRITTELERYKRLTTTLQTQLSSEVDRLTKESDDASDSMRAAHAACDASKHRADSALCLASQHKQLSVALSGYAYKLSTTFKSLLSCVACSNCLQPLEDPVTILPCFHTFCAKCFERLSTATASGTSKCPSCRTSIVSIHHNELITSLIFKLQRVVDGVDMMLKCVDESGLRDEALTLSIYSLLGGIFPCACSTTPVIPTLPDYFNYVSLAPQQWDLKIIMNPIKPPSLDLYHYNEVYQGIFNDCWLISAYKSILMSNYNSNQDVCPAQSSPNYLAWISAIFQCFCLKYHVIDPIVPIRTISLPSISIQLQQHIPSSSPIPKHVDGQPLTIYRDVTSSSPSGLLQSLELAMAFELFDDSYSRLEGGIPGIFYHFFNIIPVRFVMNEKGDFTSIYCSSSRNKKEMCFISYNPDHFMSSSTSHNSTVNSLDQFLMENMENGKTNDNQNDNIINVHNQSPIIDTLRKFVFSDEFYICCSKPKNRSEQTVSESNLTIDLDHAYCVSPIHQFTENNEIRDVVSVMLSDGRKGYPDQMVSLNQVFTRFTVFNVGIEPSPATYRKFVTLSGLDGTIKGKIKILPDKISQFQIANSPNNAYSDFISIGILIR
ncbi:hypothetical protein ADUPG1_008012 [Aduncisulcus paluster]|uniref:RING-type domain-containing protein n=1 Tax=Aduncisulcus paluster TaxID=2918883 RepID=A0ABQ5KTJ0_9EUKA|nr:hypothetical protein ADUPG1_008012 [Aduncisulcus paluster]